MVLDGASGPIQACSGFGLKEEMIFGIGVLGCLGHLLAPLQPGVVQPVAPCP